MRGVKKDSEPAVLCQTHHTDHKPATSGVERDKQSTGGTLSYHSMLQQPRMQQAAPAHVAARGAMAAAMSLRE